MLLTTSLFTFLAGASAAASSTVLPSFVLEGPTTSTPAPTVTSTIEMTTIGSRVPASLSFDPSKAPIFAPSSGGVDFSTLPAFPSTPCASKIMPSMPADAASSIVMSTGQPIQAPALTPVSPTGQFSALSPITSSSSHLLLSSRPAPSIGPGYGWGRPRPSGMWPNMGPHRPTGALGHPRPRPSGTIPHPSGGMKSNIYNSEVLLSSRPCTLETRVRTTATIV